MKTKNLTILFLMSCCLTLRAQTNIFFNLTDFSINPATNRLVYVTSYSVPTVSSSSVIISSKLSYTTDTNGSFTITNAALNILYQIQVSAPPMQTIFTIYTLPSLMGSGTNVNGNLLMVASSTSTFPAGTVALAAAISDLRYIHVSNSVPNGLTIIATNGTYVWAAPPSAPIQNVIAGTGLLGTTNGVNVTITTNGGASGGGIGNIFAINGISATTNAGNVTVGTNGTPPMVLSGAGILGTTNGSAVTITTNGGIVSATITNASPGAGIAITTNGATITIATNGTSPSIIASTNITATTNGNVVTLSVNQTNTFTGDIAGGPTASSNVTLTLPNIATPGTGLATINAKGQATATTLNGSTLTSLSGGNITSGTVNSNALDTATKAQLALAGTGASNIISGTGITVTPSGGNATVALTSPVSTANGGTGNTSGTVASFTGSLVGDVTGTQGATIVADVGGVTAFNVAAGATLANTATSANTASELVKRDVAGNAVFEGLYATNFIGGSFTGAFTGNASGITNYPTTNATSSLFGVVKVDGTSITASGGVITAISVASNILSGNNITVTPTAGNATVNLSGTISTNNLPSPLAALVSSNGVNLTNTVGFNTNTYSFVDYTTNTIIIQGLSEFPAYNTTYTWNGTTYTNSAITNCWYYSTDDGVWEQTNYPGNVVYLANPASVIGDHGAFPYSIVRQDTGTDGTGNYGTITLSLSRYEQSGNAFTRFDGGVDTTYLMSGVNNHMTLLFSPFPSAIISGQNNWDYGFGSVMNSCSSCTNYGTGNFMGGCSLTTIIDFSGHDMALGVENFVINTVNGVSATIASQQGTNMGDTTCGIYNTTFAYMGPTSLDSGIFGGSGVRHDVIDGISSGDGTTNSGTHSWSIGHQNFNTNTTDGYLIGSSNSIPNSGTKNAMVVGFGLTNKNSGTVMSGTTNATVTYSNATVTVTGILVATNNSSVLSASSMTNTSLTANKLMGSGANKQFISYDLIAGAGLLGTTNATSIVLTTNGGAGGSTQVFDPNFVKTNGGVIVAQNPFITTNDVVQNGITLGGTPSITTTNILIGYNSTIADGLTNFNSISGGSSNKMNISVTNSVIAGGYSNNIGSNSFSSVISGGASNSISDTPLVIFINDGYNNISGGLKNSIGSGQGGSVISGGVSNSIGTNTGYAALEAPSDNISGGQQNVIGSLSSYCSIGGGLANTINNGSTYGTIPGGAQNIVGGSYGFAAGQNASSTHNNSFVWSDGATFADTASSQYLIHAGGGVGINTNNPGTNALSVYGGVNITGNASTSTFTMTSGATNGNIVITGVGGLEYTTNTLPASVIAGGVPVVNRGSTNATTLTSFTATFVTAFSDTNYTALAIGNGFALAGSYVSSKTTTTCVFNMTVATGTIDWVAIHP